MRIVWTIAAHTFRENRRDRVLYVLLLFAAVMIASSVVVGELSPFEQEKILLDLGQSVMQVAGALIAIFLGVGLVSREIERRTVYVIISKPVGRTQFLLGRVMGLGITLSASLAIMALTLGVVTWAYGEPPGLPLAQSVILIWIEVMLVVALAVTFASFSTMTLSAMFTIGVWVIGQIVADLKGLAEKSESVVTRIVLEGSYWIFPNLSLFDAKSRATYGIPLTLQEMSWSVGYGIAYVTALLSIASLLFSKRDFR